MIPSPDLIRRGLVRFLIVAVKGQARANSNAAAIPSYPNLSTHSHSLHLSPRLFILIVTR
jgi:hypothetical protein